MEVWNNWSQPAIDAVVDGKIAGAVFGQHVGAGWDSAGQYARVATDRDGIAKFDVLVPRPLGVRIDIRFEYDGLAADFTVYNVPPKTS